MGNAHRAARYLILLCTCAGAAVLCPSIATCQQLGDNVSPIEAYLEDHNLPWALATELRQRMKSVSASDRLALANRLGRIYVQLIDTSRTPEERDRLEELGKQLLNDVPEADSFDLRISLAKARYMYAETIAINNKLELADPEKIKEAVAILNETIPVFRDVASKTNRQVELIERRMESVRLEDEAGAKAQLADAQRLRSIASYYAGWSTYYLGSLTKNPRLADDALRSFGWLLNAQDGKPASVERAPVSYFRLDHVARAAMGAGLCEALRGNTSVALRWLDLVERNEEISDDIRNQLFMFRITMLCDGGRWSDLDSAANRRRKEVSGPLDVALARLICVAALRSLESGDTPKLAQPLVERISSDALADLVELGEIANVLDIVKTFGAAQLGDDGFIVRYVRGLVQFEDAKEARIQAGEALELPSKDNEMRRRFSQAANALTGALTADDSDGFSSLHPGLGLMAGISMFQAAEFAKAAEHLEKTFHLYPDAGSAEESLWLAIVSLDQDQDVSRRDHKEKITELAAVFLAKFPAGERAATLVMRDGADALIDQNKAIEVLLGVPSSSNLYISAQQQVAKLLYKRYRHARGSERDISATRFLAVADRILDLYRRRMNDANHELSDAAAQNSVVLIRQMLDVVTGMPAPDISRAKAALALLESLRTRDGIDLSEAEDELELRRLQIALYEGDQETVDAIAAQLDSLGEPYDKIAAGVIFEHAIRMREKLPNDADTHRQVVRTGVKLIDSYGPAAEALKQPSVAGLYARVADSASRVYELAGDKPMLDLAMRIDAQLIEAGHTSLDVLKRHAALAEKVNQPKLAYEAWQIILQGSVASSDLWFQARYESLRVLAMFDASRASLLMSQHQLLYPDYGPEPWGTKLRTLTQEINKAATQPLPAQESEETR